MWYYIEKYNDLKEGDIIEAFEMVEIQDNFGNLLRGYMLS